MKPDIENLKVWISGRSTTGYQRALAMREFEQLLTYVAELEQLRQPPVSGSFSQKDMEKFAAKCMILGHGGKTTKELLKDFCDNDR